MNLFEKVAKSSHKDTLDTTVNTIGGGALAVGGLGTIYDGSKMINAKRNIGIHKNKLNEIKQKVKKTEGELNDIIESSKEKNIKKKALSQLKDNIKDYKKGVEEQLSKNPIYKNTNHKEIVQQALKNTFGHSIKNYDKRIMRNLDQRIKEINDGLYQHRVTGEFFHSNELKKANNKYQTALRDIKPSLGLLGVGLGALGYQVYKNHKKQKGKIK
jgi:hypothetical protein